MRYREPYDARVSRAGSASGCREVLAVDLPLGLDGALEVHAKSGFLYTGMGTKISL